MKAQTHIFCKACDKTFPYSVDSDDVGTETLKEWVRVKALEEGWSYIQRPNNNPELLCPSCALIARKILDVLR